MPKDSLILVEDDGLQKLNARPPLMIYMRELWGRRFFITAQARAKALKGGQGMFLGKLWLLLNPLFSIAVFAVVFGLVLKVSRGMDNFIGFLAIGVIFFGFLSGGITGGSGLIQNSKSLMRAFAFPKASLVFSAMIRQFWDNLLPAVIAIIGALLFQLDKPISWTVLLVVPLYLLIHLFGLGASFFTARLTSRIPDLKKVIALIMRGLFFLSGVFFPVDRFADIPVLREFMLANPLYQFLHAVRMCVLDGAVPELGVWLYLSAWSFGLVFIGFIFFWQAEARYATVK